jgi:hypothetical protein
MHIKLEGNYSCFQRVLNILMGDLLLIRSHI